MPPRGHEGYDFTPILTHYLFLFTTILAIAGWFTAFIGQIVATANLGNGNVGTLWFAIFLQLFLILGVLHTLATDTIGMNRFQISIFGAIAIVFAVNGVNMGIFSGFASLDAMSAGWLLLALVDILWVLYFTSEEDSLALHIFNSMGTGGLTPPNRRRRTRGQSMHMGGNGNGYAAGGYAAGGGIGSGDMPYDSKMTGGPVGIRSQNSIGGGSMGAAGGARSIGGGTGAGSIAGGPPGGGMSAADSVGVASPLMGSGAAGVGAGGGMSGGSPDGTGPADTPGASEYSYKAKALYAYNASPDDPNEISFTKGEILDIVDKQGKWWQARKADGSLGIAPSNYLQII